MSQKNSDYKRKSHDSYETPEWVTQALVPHLPRRVKNIWEPAAGSGKMVKVLRKAGYKVIATDINTRHDFLRFTSFVKQSIITNPPYSHAHQFIANALALTYRHKGVVAMLLRVDFDSAKTRRDLFADHPAFTKKIVLLKRIRWIEGSTGSPSENHAWFVWDWTNKDKPTISYEPQE